MKKIIIAGVLLVCFVCQTPAQRRTRDIDETYRRSSLYSFLVSHSDTKFHKEIEACFNEIPIPDTYNDHDLSVKVVSTDKKLPPETVKRKEDPKGKPEINYFLEQNKIASRLVAKWYDYNPLTGDMDIDLVGERGIYAASEIEKAKAATSVRGMEAVLADAGEDLIQNTFVLVNDITYIDKSKGSAVVGSLLRIAGGVLAQSMHDNTYNDLGNVLGDVAETFKGFSVRVHSSLYQLVWTEEEEANLYNMAWNDKEAFENMRGKFKLKYVGDQLSSGSTTSFMGIREDQPERMVRKACQRALDENIANLQKNFQVFQIKSPLDVETMEAKVGKKEGITESSLFEVLERVKDDTGKVIYKKVGEVKPVPNLIWDNRYMAVEEMAQGATLGATTFKKVSGGDFTPGCLIRQIK
ncbi:MAG: hypothetical protein LUI08_05670 [Prevotella sp.]|nr:hypothetical protein [Prevotella sp.]